MPECCLFSPDNRFFHEVDPNRSLHYEAGLIKSLAIFVYFRHKAGRLKLANAILLVIIFKRPNLLCSNIYSLGLFVLEMPYHKKRKTDRPPREFIPEDSMKAAGLAVLDGKPVNAVAREEGLLTRH